MKRQHKHFLLLFIGGLGLTLLPFFSPHPFFTIFLIFVFSFPLILAWYKIAFLDLRYIALWGLMSWVYIACALLLPQTNAYALLFLAFFVFTTLVSPKLAQNLLKPILGVYSTKNLECALTQIANHLVETYTPLHYGAQFAISIESNPNPKTESLSPLSQIVIHDSHNIAGKNIPPQQLQDINAYIREKISKEAAFSIVQNDDIKILKKETAHDVLARVKNFHSQQTHPS